MSIHATTIHYARHDIEAAIRETKFITDPRDVGVQANIRQRLKFVLEALDIIEGK